MKTALITHHKIPNFGANLQALSTHKLLSSFTDNVVLDYTLEKSENRYRDICPEVQFDEHCKFAKTFMNLSPKLRNEDELLEYCKAEGVECIISGSDSIFRLTKNFDSHEGKFPNPYWLNWAKKDPSYQPKTAFISGSATGSSYYSFPKELRSSIYSVLQEADYLSVRDEWTKMMFKIISKGKLNPSVTPDPVFSFNSNVHIDDITKAHDNDFKKPYIIYSARNGRVSVEWLNKFTSICHSNGFKVYGLCLPELNVNYDGFDKNFVHPLSPEKWYSLIKNASGVFGERFHLAVSALANSVPLVSIDHYRKEGVKNKLMFLNFPMTSKVYGIMKKADLVSHCVFYKKLKTINPMDVFNLLSEYPTDKITSFVANEVVEFKKTIHQIVEC